MTSYIGWIKEGGVVEREETRRVSFRSDSDFITNSQITRGTITHGCLVTQEVKFENNV